MTLASPCLICGRPAIGSRCSTHALPPRSRPSPSQRGYDYKWQALSRLARALSPICADCGALDDLTADHLRWPAYTLDDVEVVCRRCNSARGALRGGGSPLSEARSNTPRVSGITHSNDGGVA